MTMVRISKYNPAFRRPDGTFSADEWTSVSDIGRVVGGKTLSVGEYLQMEQSYIDAVVMIFSQPRTVTFVVREIEVSSRLPGVLYASNLYIDPASVKRGDTLLSSNISNVLRLALREIAWLSLDSDDGAYIHFGYDYYVYVNAPTVNLQNIVIPKGIYVEYFVSPYLI